MKTPICDFVSEYSKRNTLRLHMPGHKGMPLLGMEALDITEIEGADSLYEASGVIRESEAMASALFGCDTYYSTEGSSQCIKAMLHLASVRVREKGMRPHIVASRNAHKAFLSAAALLDFDVTWIYPRKDQSYLTCCVDTDMLRDFLYKNRGIINILYLTAPDYLGNMIDLRKIARICHDNDVMLVVDNAHGAYLRFLPESMHPSDMGADLCCDSAHKTLPVLTGGAYLHISGELKGMPQELVKNALAMFGSTSPSYLILQSLDAANRYISEGYGKRLDSFIPVITKAKKCLEANGYTFCGDEPLKLTVCTKKYGYLGTELASLLAELGIVCEFADRDFLVMMLTPEIREEGLRRMTDALLSIPRRSEISEAPPEFVKPEIVMTAREATFEACETVPAEKSLGRILAAANVGCPPAVPILVCGERIDQNAIERFIYYGIDRLTVVK